jgi:hypothetical protein
MERVDRVPRVQVQAVGVGALRCDGRVEVELVAAEPPGLVHEPVEDQAGVSASARALDRRQVVEVEVVLPRQAVPSAEPADRPRLLDALVEHAHEAIALRSEHLVDVTGELALAGQVRAQRAEGLERESGLGREDLADAAQL